MKTPEPVNAAETPEDWPEALATVLRCRYDMRVGRALAFGVPSSKHFRITYNYFAAGPDGEGETHTAELYSPIAIAQNTLFPVRYNPELPADHLHAYSSYSPDQIEAGGPATAPASRTKTLAIGIVGSVLLSLAWLALLHSCR